MLSACSAEEVGGTASSVETNADGALPVEMVDEGSWYVRQPWPHDGNPIESVTFVVYSDAAAMEARREMADAAERVWAELLDELGVVPEMLRFLPGKEKLDIYAYYDYYPQDWSGGAYYGGLLIWSPDHPVRQFDRDGYEPTLKHELVHVLQWMLTGGAGTIDTWFIEGLPLALASDLARQPIRDLEQLNDLTAEYGDLNPISIKRYSQITDPEAGEHFFYPMFQLAFEYLLDDEGLGRSPTDARDVMLDMAEGASFEAAFEDNMGLTLGEFESGFSELMSDYLS
jgi:hypothetical protein